MGTLFLIVGGLAAIGWASEALSPGAQWRDLERRWSAPVKPAPRRAKPAKPRVVQPTA